jgi:ASC-1-like (ASCH) protein
MSYDIAEAKKLLEDKLKSAEMNSVQLGEDIGFIREQITTLEVTMARVYNFTVKMRKSATSSYAMPGSSSIPASS